MLNSKLLFIAGGALMQWVVSTKEGKQFANNTIDTLHKTLKEQISNMSKSSKKKEEPKKDILNGK